MKKISILLIAFIAGTGYAADWDEFRESARSWLESPEYLSKLTIEWRTCENQQVNPSELRSVTLAGHQIPLDKDFLPIFASVKGVEGILLIFWDDNENMASINLNSSPIFAFEEILTALDGNISKPTPDEHISLPRVHILRPGVNEIFTATPEQIFINNIPDEMEANSMTTALFPVDDKKLLKINTLPKSRCSDFLHVEDHLIDEFSWSDRLTSLADKYYETGVINLEDLRVIGFVIGGAEEK